jgi:hypothetical protein
MTEFIIGEKPQEFDFFPNNLLKRSIVMADIDKTGYFYLPGIEIPRYMGYDKELQWFWFLTETAEIYYGNEDYPENIMESFYKEYNFANIFQLGKQIVSLREEEVKKIDEDYDYYKEYFNKKGLDLILEYNKHFEAFLLILQNHIENNKKALT